MTTIGKAAQTVRRITWQFAVLVALGTVAGVASLPTSVSASTTGTTGYHEPAEVECNLMVGNSMLVHAPLILAAPVSVPANVAIVGDPHSQWVAYRATLKKWDVSKSKYATSSVGNWISSNVPSNINNFVSPWYLEWSESQRQWINSATYGATYFRDLVPGFYRVSIEYHWYSDSQAGPGDDVIESTDYVYTQTYKLIHTSNCQY